MPHFYIKPENIKGSIFCIQEDQSHYLLNVRRFKINDSISLFDGTGTSYKAKIDSIGKNKISGYILSSSYKEVSTAVTLYTCIPQGDRFKWLIEKCSEIGVFKITPITTKRSIITSISKNKLERYEKISLSASSQCCRADIMQIENIIDFKTACTYSSKNNNFVGIIPWENENNNSLKSLITELSYKSINIFIGPEGGFENEEVEFAKSLGIKTITLGKNILRTETAAVATSVLITQLLNGLI